MPQSRILIFCGKGGVGKTTLSLAKALRHAAEGLRTVVVTSHPLKELAVAVSLDGLQEQSPTAAKNLFVVHIDAKEQLAEVVRENFPVEWVASAVLDSKIYRNLIEVAPGLKEFYFLARLQALAERTASGQPDFDLLLWDAPSTGHFLSTLHSAKNFEQFLSGPLAIAGTELARFFSNAAKIAVYPVTTLEEMAIEETVEMCRRLDSEFSLRATRLLLNLVSPLATATDAEIAALQSTPADAGLRFAIERGAVERERAKTLRATLSVDSLAIERARSWTSDLDLLGQLGGALEPLPA